MTPYVHPHCSCSRHVASLTEQTSRIEMTNSSLGHDGQGASHNLSFPAQRFRRETHTIGRRRGCFGFMSFVFLCHPLLCWDYGWIKFNSGWNWAWTMTEASHNKLSVLRLVLLSILAVSLRLYHILNLLLLTLLTHSPPPDLSMFWYP